MVSDGTADDGHHTKPPYISTNDAEPRQIVCHSLLFVYICVCLRPSHSLLLVPRCHPILLCVSMVRECMSLYCGRCLPKQRGLIHDLLSFTTSFNSIFRSEHDARTCMYMFTLLFDDAKIHEINVIKITHISQIWAQMRWP